MTTNKLLLSIAPVTAVTGASILAVGLAIGSVMLALSGPRLGLELDRSYTGSGLRIEKVIVNGPASDKLHSGDIIQAFITTKTGRVEVLSSASLEDPVQLTSYALYNSFFLHQQALWDSISSDTLTVILSDDRQIELASLVQNNPRLLPSEFWWMLFFGGSSFLIGVSIWSLKSTDATTRVLVISSFGFMIGCYSCAIYISREIALPSSLFFALASINHLGLMVFAYSGILFLWFYPSRLGSSRVAWLIVLWVATVWINEILQWWSWPIHTYYAHTIIIYCLLIAFALLQLRNSKGATLEHSMLKWLLIITLLSLGFSSIFFFIPIIFTGKANISTVFALGSLFVLYLGLAVGTVRFQLFDMQHWWLTVWKCSAFIFIALIADVFFFYFLHLNNTISIVLALVAGSAYLVLRQLYWSRYPGNGKYELNQALPHLVEALVFKQRAATSDLQWMHLLERVFNTLSTKVISLRRENISIDKGGLILQIPSLNLAYPVACQ